MIEIISMCKANKIQMPQGFTLMEVMMIVILVAILSALAIPMFGNTGRINLQAAAQIVMADLGYAQIESITHDEKVWDDVNKQFTNDDLRVVVFDTNNNLYHIATAADTTTPINDLSGNPYRVILGQGRASNLGNVTISSVDFDGDNVLGFGLYGNLDQNYDATITLACNGESLMITVDYETGDAWIP